MQHHELTAWLGDVDATDEQREQLHRAADMIDSRYPADVDDKGGAASAFSMAAQVILGDATLDEAAAAWKAARLAERAAMDALTGAIIATIDATSENAIAQHTGINRMTIRKALGK